MSLSASTYAEPLTYQGLNHRTVADVQKKIVKQGKRNAVSQLLHAKKDKDMIAACRREVNRILRIFNVRSVDAVWRLLSNSFQTELSISTHTILLDIRRNALAGQESTDSQHQSVSTTFPVRQ